MGIRISSSWGQRILVRLVLSAVATIGATGVEGKQAHATLIINYEIFGTNAFAPNLLGWSELGTTGAGISVGPTNDPASGGGAAWNVADNSSALSPIYFYGLGANDQSKVDQEGWWLRVRARYLTDYDTGVNLGLQAYFAGKAYKVLLDLDSRNDLRATLPGLASPFLLTQGGTGVDAYHTFDLFAEPQSTLVTFRFDGRELAQWNGVNSTAGHPDVVKWGLEGPADRGSMNFREVVLATGPPPVVAASDYNGDGRVDGEDLALWSENFGSTSATDPGDGDQDNDVDGADFLQWQQEVNAGNQNAPVVPVPEPSTCILLGLGATGLVVGRAIPYFRRGR